ncbi:MAG: acryloyl-CoA reductase [Desulfobacteraceae bacterium]|nr:MAG: acryloyl-CoA reductase [Desulfobacteraceae bacterium]
MENKTFRAMVVEEVDKGVFTRKITDRTIQDLPEGDVLIRVHYSSLNYKDALSASGNRGVTRNFPHTPGIDAAGVVEESGSDLFQKGQEVLVTSYDLGMNTSGGFAQYVRVPAEWVVKLPGKLGMKESMCYGTAGFTAGMSVDKLMGTVPPSQGEILVTGATGGVGCMAAGILAGQGYSVTAVSGKPDAKELLASLGVKNVITRDAFLEGADRPLLKPRWSGVVDTVGGEILAAAIKATLPLGVVTCCGNVASADLPITVFPFILRGVTLVGIDSQNCPMTWRKQIWDKLAGDWKFAMPEDLVSEISLDDLDDAVKAILKGQVKGRRIVNLNR